MSQKLKFLGVPVFMNGQNYYVPSLSYQDFKANYELLTTAPAEESKLFEYFDQLVPVIGKAVRRNYEDVTDEQLAGWLDMTTLPMSIKAVQAESGITPVSEGE